MRAKTIFLLLITLLLTSAVNARSRYPKREFRGAWIQCVNGQFQGMPAEKMQQLLIRQLNSLQEAGINAIIFQVRAEADALYNHLTSRGAASLPGCRAGYRHLIGTLCSL